MATSTTSVALSPLLVKLNVTGLQKRDQPLYDFLSHLLFATGQVANAVGVASSSSGGGGGSTTNVTNIVQQFNLGDSGSVEDGSPGPPGPQGNPGSSGSTGASGAIGPATYLTDISAPDEVFPIPGPIGPTGNTGLIGNDGPAIFITAQDGMDGEPSSIPGPPGPQGNTGLTGATGNDGPGIFITDEHYVDDPIPIPGGQGPTGNPGPTGPSGPSGSIFASYVDLTDTSQETTPVMGIVTQSAIGQIKTIIRSTNQSTTSTTVANDDTLFFPTGPNQVYTIEAFVFLTTGVSTAVDFKWAWTYPSGTMTVMELGLPSSATTGTPSIDATASQVVSPNGVSGIGVISTAVSPQTPYWQQAVFRCGTIAGTVQFQWAQNSVSTTIPLVVNKDSFIRYIQVA